jgi:hypothetical protein
MFVVVGGGTVLLLLLTTTSISVLLCSWQTFNVLSQKTASSSSSIIYITLKQRNANFPPDVLAFFLYLVVFVLILIILILVLIFPFSFSPEELRGRGRERENTRECPFFSNPSYSHSVLCCFLLIWLSPAPRYK